MKYDKQLIPAALIGISLIVAGIFIGSPWRVPKDDVPTLTITGIAKQAVVSDNAKWSFAITRDIAKTDLAKGYTQIAQDEKAVRSFLKERGITEAQIDILPVSADQIYGSNGPILDQLTLRQSITIKSPDITNVAAVANGLDSLLASGIIISSPTLEYLYSKLDETQGEVVAQAIENASSVASNLSLKRGKKLGGVLSATVRSIQLLPPGSSTTPDYTTIDTSTINKELRVIVEVTFKL